MPEMSTGFKVFSVKKRDFRHNIWLKRANQKRKYSDQPKKQASYRLLYSLIGWESINQDKLHFYNTHVRIHGL